MEAFEEVADTFSDCDGCPDYFSSRMGSLNLSFTSTSFDPAFTFDTSSRSSSLRHCDSTSRSSGDAFPTAPPLLAVVSASPCASMRRAVTVVRRTSLPNAPAPAADPSVQPCRLACSPCCPTGGGTPPLAPSETPNVQPLSETLRGSLKRRSCPDPDSGGSHASEPPVRPKADPAGGLSPSEMLQPGSPNSPASSFASFAAALAAHYYADFGSVPDVPQHLEQARQRAGKRQRIVVVEQTTDV